VTTPTIHQLAGWDVPELRAGVGRLGQVADRLVPWRSRLDALGRQLGTAECWSGPAGTVAAAALVELSTVACRLSAVLDSSLGSLAGLSSAAEEARDWAAGARAAAAEAGAGWDAAGQLVGLPPPPSPAMAVDQAADVVAAWSAGRLAAARADEALAAAARALGCAREAQQPLAGACAPGGGPPGFEDLFEDLVVRLGPGAVAAGPVPAPGTDPRTVATWWSGLTAAEQLAVITRRPGRVGALDGLPGWARDRANRIELAAALATLPPGSAEHRMARSVESALAGAEAAGGVVQLLQFDPAADLVAVSVGDVDTAAAVGVLVPGIETTPTGDLAGLVGNARDVVEAATAAAPGLAVATIAWLGYRTPGWQTAFLPGAAGRGGQALDRALDGLAAARTGPGTPRQGAAGPPRTTVVAHSYGTVVTGRAVRAPGRLAADALVLLGSPGVVAGDAGDLEADEVYGAWSPGDPVSWLEWFGDTPADPSFGDVPLPVEPTEWHTEYYDADRPTLAAIGEVVAGVRDGG
jgi:Alpha/beta hydrolase